MSDPFLAEIRVVSFAFAPKGWALCDGRLLPINQNQALFSLLGTAYGGDGRTTFALPDLRGRAPAHVGSITLGERGGEETQSLTEAQLPAHTHVLGASSQRGSLDDPAGAVWAGPAAGNLYSAEEPDTTMQPESVTPFGNGQPHENMQPYLVLNFVIAIQGIFPSRN